MSDLKSLVEPVTRGDPMHRRANLMPPLRQRCHEVTTRLARNAAPRRAGKAAPVDARLAPAIEAVVGGRMGP